MSKPRCVVCRTRCKTFTALMAHMKQAQHNKPCICGSYHFPHRPGSGCCRTSPMTNYNYAKRSGVRGEVLEDAFFEDVLFGKFRSSAGGGCPF